LDETLVRAQGAGEPGHRVLYPGSLGRAPRKKQIIAQIVNHENRGEGHD
jgi:hypothetical protein